MASEDNNIEDAKTQMAMETMAQCTFDIEKARVVIANLRENHSWEAIERKNYQLLLEAMLEDEHPPVEQIQKIQAGEIPTNPSIHSLKQTNPFIGGNEGLFDFNEGMGNLDIPDLEGSLDLPDLWGSLDLPDLEGVWNTSDFSYGWFNELNEFDGLLQSVLPETLKTETPKRNDDIKSIETGTMSRFEGVSSKWCPFPDDNNMEGAIGIRNLGDNDIDFRESRILVPKEYLMNILDEITEDQKNSFKRAFSCHIFDEYKRKVTMTCVLLEPGLEIIGDWIDFLTRDGMMSDQLSFWGAVIRSPFENEINLEFKCQIDKSFSKLPKKLADKRKMEARDTVQGATYLGKKVVSEDDASNHSRFNLTKTIVENLFKMAPFAKSSLKMQSLPVLVKSTKGIMSADEMTIKVDKSFRKFVLTFGWSTFRKKWDIKAGREVTLWASVDEEKKITIIFD